MGRARRRKSNSHAGGRARGGPGPYLLFGLIFVALLGVTLYAVKAGGQAHAGTSAAEAATTDTTAPAVASVTAAPKTSTPKTTAPKTTPATPTTPSVPKHGSGTFSTADASGKAVGHGDIRRYEVQVEGGAGISSTTAAEEIQEILGNPRGWTADGHDGFQLVSSGPADFVIKVATPDTVDAICGAAGLHTHGEVNCDVGATVVVNLKRWQLGSPEFHGPIDGYRALIINHEVGHRIGHGHEGCPGPGKLAPVMMQQIDGLHGCKANQWPYDANGHYIQGPPVA
jgi:Rieske Fe-S protein